MKQSSLLLECDCCCSILRVDCDEDCLFYVSIYQMDKKHDWWYRVRMIWHIIRTGTPYEDETVLSPEKAKELAKYIKEKV